MDGVEVAEGNGGTVGLSPVAMVGNGEGVLRGCAVAVGVEPGENVGGACWVTGAEFG